MARRPIDITKATLKAAADSRSWQRGEGYFGQGRVSALFEDGGEILAKVSGTRTYRVALCVEDGEIEGECTCPMGDAGVFCKHCVAVGLAYLDQGADSIGPAAAKGSGEPRGEARPRVTLDDVRKYLSAQDKAELVETIMGQVRQDDRLRESLLMKVARGRPGGLDLATFRRVIDNATDAGGFVDYGSAHDFARGIENVVDSIAELLDQGHGEEVIELAEYALRNCEDALGGVDDSDGDMGGILERLQEIHHAACAAAKPDGEALARRLFEWEMSTDWDTFYGAAEAYADVFGEKGLAVYRQLAQSLWDKTPPLGPSDERSFEGHRFRLTSIMESLARADGDVEALVAVKSRDLSSAWSYLEIAEIYKHARKHDKALEWAERGIKEFPNGADPRLEDFLADEYHRLKRHDEAMALIWEQFVRHTSLSAYQHLHKHAGKMRKWPTWRQKALEHIEAEIGKSTRGSGRNRWDYHPYDDHSLLVEIFLWEKAPEKAWKEAQTGGCSRALWLELAAAREAEQPDDAIAIYREEVDRLVQPTTNGRYEEPAALVRRIGKLMGGAGRKQDFAPYLADLRARFKRKRNFMALLKRMKP